jgi:hypothetical protein
MRGKHFLATILVFLLVSACSTSMTDTTEMDFSDVPSGEVWGDAIKHICSDGYMHGKAGDTFDPYAPLTRAEAAVIMMRIEHGTDYVPENNEGEWWAKWVSEAVSEGLMDAVKNPDSPATRADIATIVWLLVP